MIFVKQFTKQNELYKNKNRSCHVKTDELI